jgi:4-hydroxy-tetrahydrodipicolinate synthase
MEARVKPNKWDKPSGKGPLGLDWSGCYPATVIPFTDRTCREIDEDAYRILLRDLLKSDIAGIDPNEVEGLSREETIRLIQIAKEETNGRIPVTGKVEPRNGNWTWDLIQEAEKVIEAGCDVLYLHPVPHGDNIEDFINLYKTFDKAFDIPIFALIFGVPVPVIKEISMTCRNMAAWKFHSGDDLKPMKEVVYAMREVEEATGRHVCPLKAGDQSLAECLVNGAEGNFNGGASWRSREDVAIYSAVKRGDLNEAFAIQKRIEPAADAVRGRYGSRSLTFWRFPHRYKHAAWLTGKIPNPYARLPRTAFSDEEVLAMRDALLKSGFNVVREPAECRGLQPASS